jgi:hypothetical protein
LFAIVLFVFFFLCFLVPSTDSTTENNLPARDKDGPRETIMKAVAGGVVGGAIGFAAAVVGFILLYKFIIVR